MQDHFPTNNHSKSQRCVKPGLQIHAIDDPRKQTLDKSFVRGVGKFPTDSAFGGTCKVPTRTRQFSDSFSLSSQFSNSVHRVWWEKTNLKFKFSFVGLEGEEGYQLKYWRGNLGSFYFAEVKATCNEKKLYCTFRATPISLPPPPKKKKKDPNACSAENLRKWHWDPYRPLFSNSTAYKHNKKS